MFVNNNQNKEIKLRSFEGYSFVIPSGVSWLYDSAAKHLLENIYAAKTVVLTAKDKALGLDNGYGIPPLLLSTKGAWLKGGKQLCQVKRYKVNGKMIPRKKLVGVAQERGVPQDRIFQYLTNDTEIDQMQIAEDINNLPVPDGVKFPADLMENDVPANTKNVAPQMA